MLTHGINHRNNKLIKFNIKMSIFILRRKNFTVYDDTDNIKRMKDSDILAERERERESFRPVASGAIKGALGGAALGGLAAGAVGAAGGWTAAKNAGATTLGSKLAGAARGAADFGRLKKYGMWGAGIGAAGMALHALSKRSDRQDEVDKYNNRLHYAQRQAMRRERADWKKNNTTRDGYSY